MAYHNLFAASRRGYADRYLMAGTPGVDRHGVASIGAGSAKFSTHSLRRTAGRAELPMNRQPARSPTPARTLEDREHGSLSRHRDESRPWSARGHFGITSRTLFPPVGAPRRSPFRAVAPNSFPQSSLAGSGPSHDRPTMSPTRGTRLCICRAYASRRNRC